VLLIRNQRQWGRHSGLVTEFPPYAFVFTLRAGEVVRVRWYPDQDSALEAAGLREWASVGPSPQPSTRACNPPRE
jgi:hypothetical protein